MTTENSAPDASEVTRLLHAWSDGDADALTRLMPLVFGDLRRIAAAHFARENAGHTLQPTALVHELYLRLRGRRHVDWHNRAQFFSFAGQLMRRILVDHARGRLTAKRGGGATRLDVDAMPNVAATLDDPEMVALDEALKDLEQIDPRQAKIVELRFFMGLNNKEIATVLGISTTTVKREWQTARLWLFREVKKS